MVCLHQCVYACVYVLCVRVYSMYICGMAVYTCVCVCPCMVLAYFIIPLHIVSTCVFNIIALTGYFKSVCTC